MLLSKLTDKEIFELVKEISAGGPCADCINVPNYVMQDAIDDIREECKTVEEARERISIIYGDNNANRLLAKEEAKIFGQEK